MAEEDAVGGASTDLDMLLSVIDALLPERSRWRGRRRIISLADDKVISVTEMSSAVAALKDPEAEEHVDAAVILRIIDQIDYLSYGSELVDSLRACIMAHAERRWASLVDPFVMHVVQQYSGHRLFDVFPKLRNDPILFRHLAAELAQGPRHPSWLKELLAELAPTRLSDCRLLVHALERRREFENDRELATSVFCALGRGMGWTPWVLLQAIVRVRPDYADPHALFERTAVRRLGPHETFDAQVTLAQAVEWESNVRTVAGALLELVGSNAPGRQDGLLARPAETKAAYVETLLETIGDEPELRQAVIEALLWFADGQAADLAQFAAVALARAEDRTSIADLANHPARHVQYGARALRAAKFGESLGGFSLPTSGGLLQSLASLEGGTSYTDETPRTWLGDRAVERLIEQTVASVEARVAREYGDHGDEGEDRLLSSLFIRLSSRFGDLTEALDAVARASSAPHRTSITMRYRNVDRAEEGAKGVRDAKSFSADLCLIVDPIFDGKPLGRRVTLVQAKRLYRDQKAKKRPAWQNSFRIDRDQLLDLMKQTHSSVYFFHGPSLGGRGVPVIPSQLVADLAGHQGSGTQLATTMVAVASRSLADWLTYDALALRIGDPYPALVTKAEGRAGSLPRGLIVLPTVEIEVVVGPRSEAR